LAKRDKFSVNGGNKAVKETGKSEKSGKSERRCGEVANKPEAANSYFEVP
jgi:hypothetical protein